MTTAKPISELVKNYQPSSNSEQPTAPAHVSELWAVMAELFSSRWTSVQPPTPTDGWLLALDGLSPADVGTGLLALRDSGREWPPSATEFRAMCKKPNRENAAMYHIPPSHQLPNLATDEEKQRGREALAKLRATL